MQAAITTIPVSKTAYWIGTSLSVFAILFLIFDGVIKVIVPTPSFVVEPFDLLGMPVSLALGVGVLELLCVALYAFPRTAVLGAILLTGHLGGAMALQVRVGAPTFNIVFPILIGLLVWGGLYLRDARLAALIPLRG